MVAARQKKSGDANESVTIRKGQSLYLARDVLARTLRFSIRQSYLEKETASYRHRVLFDLGDNPEQYLVYIGDNGYYVCDELVEAIDPFLEKDTEDLLEDLLWPFVRKDIRLRLEPFRSRSKPIKPSPVTKEQLEAIEREIHVFDRRRLHYLWYGSIDQSRLHQMPPKLLRKLLGMSRDEKEQYFMAKEQNFYVDEVKSYLYTVFNLSSHFTETIARFMPQGLSMEKLDEYFLEELCRLDRDEGFRQAVSPGDRLSPYLIRYLILFFDYDFGRSQALNDYIRQFMNSHRTFRFPKKKPAMSMDEASEVFEESREKLTRMTKRQLTRLYRQKAKKLHPDTGGGHDDFVRLTEAYDDLMRRK